MKICDDHKGQINLRAKEKYEVLSATPLIISIVAIISCQNSTYLTSVFFLKSKLNESGALMFICVCVGAYVLDEKKINLENFEKL